MLPAVLILDSFSYNSSRSSAFSALTRNALSSRLCWTDSRTPCDWGLAEHRGTQEIPILSSRSVLPSVFTSRTKIDRLMDRTSEMPPEEQIHCDLMRSMARSLSETPLILKGGTSLLLAYGLDRFSEDLGFRGDPALCCPPPIPARWPRSARWRNLLPWCGQNPWFVL